MYRAVTDEYENGGWRLTVRSNERKTLSSPAARTGHPEGILALLGTARPKYPARRPVETV